MRNFFSLFSSRESRRAVPVHFTILILFAAACGDSVSGPEKGRVRLGTWGGDSAGLEVTETGATARFSCGRGIVTQPLLLDRNGRFDVPATHFIEIGPASLRHPARYTASTDGNRMTLTVTILDSGQVFGPFRLVFGRTFNGPVCV